MTQFKTVALPATEIKVKAKDMYTQETANAVLAPVSEYIMKEAKGGWKLHSFTTMNAVIIRKKGILELIFGWIPFIGIFFKSNKPDVVEPTYYCMVFEKEV